MLLETWPEPTAQFSTRRRRRYLKKPDLDGVRSVRSSGTRAKGLRFVRKGVVHAAGSRARHTGRQAAGRRTDVALQRGTPHTRPE